MEKRHMSAETKPVVVINIFTPKPGALDDFLALQTAALPGLRAGATGSRGSRLFRAEDNGKAVMVSVFDTAEDFKRFTESAPLAAHRGKMLQLLERAEAGQYQLVYQSGDV
jgi:heme-degrading monooxygenase HmoA